MRMSSSHSQRSTVLSALALYGLIGFGAANAGAYSYICTIESFHDPNGDKDAGNFLGNLALEDTLAIDRRTGAMIHPVLGNTSYRTTTVLDAGVGGWSFRVLSESGTGPDKPTGGSVVYVEVQEWVEDLRKPFLAVAEGIAFLGYCE